VHDKQEFQHDDRFAENALLLYDFTQQLTETQTHIFRNRY